MDDKTAAIPSLKDFKNNKDKKNTSQKTKSSVSRDTMRIDRARPDSKQGDSSRSHSPRRPASQRKQEDTRQNRTKSAKAPSTYARDRLGNNSDRGKTRSSDYDSSRRVDRSAQEKRRASQDVPRDTRPAQRQKRPSESYYDDIPLRKSSSVPKKQTGEQRPEVSDTVKRSAAQRTASKKKTKTPKPQKPREKKPRRANKKTLKTVLITVSVLAVLVVILILSLTVFFKAKNIAVAENDMYTSEEIITASGITDGDNILLVNKQKAAERIEKLCPYVEDAEVSSVFPDKINIKLTMAEPVCKIEAVGKKMYILNDKGKVLEVTSMEDKTEVPVLKGVQVDGTVAGEFVDFGSEVLVNALGDMFSAFSQYDCKQITEIDIMSKEDDIVEIRYLYDDRIVVYLGFPEEINYKIKAADKILDKLDKEDGSKIYGELDASVCHETMQAYFNPVSALDSALDTHIPPEPTTAVQEEEPEYYEDYYEEPTAVYDY